MTFRRIYPRYTRAEIEQFFALLRVDAKNEAKLRRAKLRICARELRCALADGDHKSASEIEALMDSIRESEISESVE